MTSRREVSRIASDLERCGVPDNEHVLPQPLPTTMELPSSKYGG